MTKVIRIIIVSVLVICAGAFFAYRTIQKRTQEQPVLGETTTPFVTQIEQVPTQASVIQSVVTAITKRKAPTSGYGTTAGWIPYALRSVSDSIIYPPTWTLVQREGWEDETIFDRQQQELQGNALTTITPPTPLSDQDKISIGDGATVNCARFDESFYGQNTRIACVFSIPIYTRSTNPETLKVFDTIITNARKTSE
jgi:uncharacterized protein YneF (UPF0154 family)